MDIRLWGCRGSLPASNNEETVRRKINEALSIAVKRGLKEDDDIESFIDRELPFWVRGSYGSNTCCVQVTGSLEEYLLVDCGSGLRDFGNGILAKHGPRPAVYNILITHLHWDHMMGFPFFPCAYIPGNKIRFFGVHEDMERAFRLQHSAPFFPIDFNDLGADIEFHTIKPGEQFEIAGCSVTSFEQDHPGVSYGYRFEKGGKVFVLSTDSEHREDAELEGYPFLQHFRDADVVVFDAQYTYQMANTSRQDWGHSSNVIGVELCKRAGVKTLVLFHQEPTLRDAALEQFLKDTRRYAKLYMPEQPLNVLMAYDGMKVEL